jgi:ssDNA-binding Zn-finger/Zn-ribbon topoisomerase 1
MESMATVVKCPVCKKRLMDMLSAKEAEVQVKCPKCRKVINVSFFNNEVHGEAV